MSGVHLDTRIGLERTFSRAVLALGMRKTRYCDPVGFHLEYLAKVVPIIAKRVYELLNRTVGLDPNWWTPIVLLS